MIVMLQSSEAWGGPVRKGYTAGGASGEPCGRKTSKKDTQEREGHLRRGEQHREMHANWKVYVIFTEALGQISTRQVHEKHTG